MVDFLSLTGNIWKLLRCGASDFNSSNGFLLSDPPFPSCVIVPVMVGLGEEMEMVGEGEEEEVPLVKLGMGR